MRVLLVGVVLVALTAMSRAGGPAVDYWPMYCRTGGGMLAMLHETSNGPREMSITFSKSSGPAGEWGAQLRPGECGFPDRALNASESNIIRVMLPAAQMKWEITTSIQRGAVNTRINSSQLGFNTGFFLDNTTFRVMMGNSRMKPGSAIRWVTDRGFDEERRN